MQIVLFCFVLVLEMKMKSENSRNMMILLCRYYKKDVWIIDVSQSVEIDHPNALHFLRNDCKNVTDYFSK